MDFQPGVNRAEGPVPTYYISAFAMAKEEKKDSELFLKYILKFIYYSRGQKTIAFHLFSLFICVWPFTLLNG